MEIIFYYFGIALVLISFLAISVYMPITNYFINKHRKEMEQNIADDEWYEVEM